MPRQKITRQQAVRHLEEGRDYREIAAIHGMTVSGVQQAMIRFGLSREYESHKDFLPWKVTSEHTRSKVADYLRKLSRLAKTGRIHPHPRMNKDQITTVINWANNILDQGLDIDYDCNKGPSEFSPQGGFYTKEADPNDWLLARLMASVRAELTKKPKT